MPQVHLIILGQFKHHPPNSSTLDYEPQAEKFSNLLTKRTNHHRCLTCHYYPVPTLAAPHPNRTGQKRRNEMRGVSVGGEEARCGTILQGEGLRYFVVHTTMCTSTCTMHTHRRHSQPCSAGPIGYLMHTAPQTNLQSDCSTSCTDMQRGVKPSSRHAA